MARRFQLTEGFIRRSLDTLAAEHPPVARALTRVGYPPSRRRPAGFAALARIVLGQQVSVAAAATIAQRLESALGGELHPAALSTAPDDTLRGAGLSRQKMRYLRALADAIQTGQLAIDELQSASDADVLEQITQIPGFGVWSAQMYLMFSLGRPDVWPAGDLAVRNGFARLLGWPERPSEGEVRAAGDPFSPHRSALALLCWRVYSDTASGDDAVPL